MSFKFFKTSNIANIPYSKGFVVASADDIFSARMEYNPSYPIIVTDESK